MSNEAYDAGATVVDATKVDLRLPQAPQPIWFRSSHVRCGEVVLDIRRYFGEGAIYDGNSIIPKYGVFIVLASGLVSRDDFVGIESIFRIHGTESQVFQYCPIERKFIGRPKEWFISERIEKV